jgi:ATP-binding cassette subfamily B protein
VDGRELRGPGLQRHRDRTAWVDPSVRLWNTTLAENVAYGAEPARVMPAMSLACVDLLTQSLPEGLETPVGEEGRRLSGGEGQQVRVARGFARGAPRLVLLDEAFRAMGRAEARRLLSAARAHWAEATLVCVTHDLEAAASFDRVLVMEGGRIVEDAPPAALAAEPASRFAALGAEYAALDEAAWGRRRWRRFRMAAGRLAESDGD